MYEYEKQKNLIHNQKDSTSLCRYYKEMEIPGKYTYQKCLQTDLFVQLYDLCGCVIVFDTMKPNDTIACTPMQLNICLSKAFAADAQIIDPNTGEKLDLVSNVLQIHMHSCKLAF